MTKKKKIAAKKVNLAKNNPRLTAAPTNPPLQTSGFPIVAVGASAGGLEAIEQFLRKVPVDTGMAFILIQHLDPNHKSILTDLIKRVTPFKVMEATDGVKVMPNCAYVIPPNRDMAILRGSLQLLQPTAHRGMRLPIDFFLRSFALDQADKAICIVLSGTGTYGTQGLKAIKEKGGMVMVQDPMTAKYDGMPRSAIGTGLTDFVLAPEQMAENLITYFKRTFAKGFKPAPLSIPKRNEDLNKIWFCRKLSKDPSLVQSGCTLRSQTIERSTGDRRSPCVVRICPLLSMLINSIPASVICAE